jgi:DNA polymerase III alpha subunit (gram-positive type)
MSKWEYILFDIECDGFQPKRIWVISMIDLITRERKSFTGMDQIAQAIMILQNARLLVGHNIKTFDVRVIEKIMEGAVTFDRSRILDTLHMSKALTKMADHKLESWGEILGVPKLPTPFSFYRWDPRMVPYCERDVDLNLQVFLALWALMEHRHGQTIPPKWEMLREYREKLVEPINTP